MSNETGDSIPLGTRILMWLITAASYLLLGLTLPVSYWWCVVTLSEHDRMVIFRLGKMIGAHGPGKVITFPWLDQCKRVDIRGSGFSVPPQQFITQVSNDPTLALHISLVYSFHVSLEDVFVHLHIKVNPLPVTRMSRVKCNQDSVLM